MTGFASTAVDEEPPRAWIYALTGDGIRALRSREQPPSPIPGVFDPAPHLQVLIGRQKTGKTTLAFVIAKAWAEGASPWPGATPLPGSRVLIVSREQPASRIDDLMRRLDHYCNPADWDLWPDRTMIVGRDLPEEARALLYIDENGLQALRAALQSAKESEDPVGLLVLDSLSRLKPASIEESDNDGMSQWLDELEKIALDFGVYVLLIHHQGHAGDGSRAEARSAGRGASAIGAVPSATLLLERVGKHKPRQRRLKVDGNFVLEAELIFDVADESSSKPGEIHFFRLRDPLPSTTPRR